MILPDTGGAGGAAAIVLVVSVNGFQTTVGLSCGKPETEARPFAASRAGLAMGSVSWGQ